ncbi:Nuclear transcription factor Y subunit gamma [Anabarilius grahami]|uniref:Nuclear transcription factor Y subunit gamma n=1 Tax=Anabarilius grahami TaxID=495550 RepID=A0A3N0YSI1_ANAGA|nr:Nuclear transcription factor Y subunit gamma [Anabarilius grahami]
MFERSFAAVLQHDESQAGSDDLADSASANGIDFLRHRVPAVIAVEATEQRKREMLCSVRGSASSGRLPAEFLTCHSNLPALLLIFDLEMSADSFGAGGSDAQQSLQTFWPRVMEEIRNLTVKDFRVQELPLARIKKIMKLDEDVKMISAEAPVLFAKAAQIFITELTLRAWIHTEDNKRRTLQRNDIAMAITKFDQFDFLIDIVPRDDLKPPKRQEEVRQSVAPTEPVQYYFTLAQQPSAVQVQGQQQGQQVAAPTATTLQPGQIIIAQPQQGQVLQGTTMQQLQQVQVAQSQATPITSAPVTMQVGEGQQVQIVQAAAQGQAQAQAAQPAGQTMQVMQQIITNTGEIQQIPVQLNTGQLQYIRLAQPVSGTQVVQGQIQTLATNAQQISQTEVQQGQQQFNQFTDGQQLYQIQQVTMPAGQELTQPMFIQSTGQTADGQVTTQVLVLSALSSVFDSSSAEKNRSAAESLRIYFESFGFADQN